jgi:TMEM175 potassium channel family protein
MKSIGATAYRSRSPGRGRCGKTLDAPGQLRNGWHHERRHHARPGSGGTTTDSPDRVIALNDRVFAIAITLLVLEIVPHFGPAVTGGELQRELLDLWPELVAYFLSFLVIGRFWDTHRAFFQHIYLADSRVVWNNLLVLLWVTLIPATAALLGSHWQEPIALALYALNLLLAILSFWGLWRYVSSGGYLRREGLHAMTDRLLDRYVAFTAIGFGLAILAAFLSPPVSFALVLLTTTLARTLARRILIAG